MNLEEFFNARTTCPICERKLECFINSNPLSVESDNTINISEKIDSGITCNNFTISLGYSENFIDMSSDEPIDHIIAIMLTSSCYHSDDGLHYTYGNVYYPNQKDLKYPDLSIAYEILSFNAQNLNIEVTMSKNKTWISIVDLSDQFRKVPQTHDLEWPALTFIGSNAITFESFKSKIIKLLPFI